MHLTEYGTGYGPSRTKIFYSHYQYTPIPRSRTERGTKTTQLTNRDEKTRRDSPLPSRPRLPRPPPPPPPPRPTPSSPPAPYHTPPPLTHLVPSSPTQAPTTARLAHHRLPHTFTHALLHLPHHHVQRVKSRHRASAAQAQVEHDQRCCGNRGWQGTVGGCACQFERG